MWLTINLATAFVTSYVVGQFEGSIEKLVALAVLMPIVAGMGGNAGTQVLALMVRGLALGQVGFSNYLALLWKECKVALLTSMALGLILGSIVQLRYGDWGLSLVIGAALIINQLAAATAGVLIPLSIRRLGFDPALASGIFLTTVTDVMGYFSFLGLATLFLLR
jgi:magnesium transporter